MIVFGEFIFSRIVRKKTIKKIIILGSKGKMGKHFASIFSSKYQIIEVDSDTPCAVELLDDEIDLVIDFSIASFDTFSYLKKALEKQIPVITGTTGRTKEELLRLGKISKQYKTSFVYKPNYALGIKIIEPWIELFKGDEWIKKIEETHALTKKDTPSGTALHLARIATIDRNNIISKRAENAKPTHSIIFENDAEIITITHTIKSQTAYDALIETYIDMIENGYVLEY